MRSLRERLGASTGCGCCAAAARECLDEALAHKRLFDGNPADAAPREGGKETPVYRATSAKVERVA